jgi:hypothetical protein
VDRPFHSENRIVFRPAISGWLSESGRILKGKHPTVLVVGKGFPIAGPGDDGAQGLFRCLLGHVIFQLVTKPTCRGAVRCSFIEHTFDVSGEGYIGEKILGKTSRTSRAGHSGPRGRIAADAFGSLEMCLNMGLPTLDDAAQRSSRNPLNATIVCVSRDVNPSA